MHALLVYLGKCTSTVKINLLIDINYEALLDVSFHQTIVREKALDRKPSEYLPQPFTRWWLRMLKMAVVFLNFTRSILWALASNLLITFKF